MEGEVRLLRARARQRPPAGKGPVGPWGVLVLTSLRLLFSEPDDGAHGKETMEEEGAPDTTGATLRLRLADVASHATTPPTSKFTCLKVTTDAGNAKEVEVDEEEKTRKRRLAGPGVWVFEFEQGAVTERDSFRDLIAQLVPPLRRLKRPKPSSPSSSSSSSVAAPLGARSVRTSLADGGLVPNVGCTECEASRVTL